MFPDLERRFWHAVLDRVDGVIGLTQTGLDLAHERFPHLASLPSFVIPHGHYRDRYPNRIDKAEARRRLGSATMPRLSLISGRSGLIKTCLA